MEGFWKSALEAADRAKEVARTVSKKGMELAEATAEEAGKKLKEAAEEVSQWNGEAGRAARVLARPPPPDPRDLAAYGVTPALAAHARALGVAAFREHQAAGAAAAPPPPLSAWRVRHALLAVRAAPEVDALRFALCPRYMDDGRFWAAYFDLCREHLPDAAFAWREGDELPELRAPAEPGGGVDPAAALAALGGQLRELGGRAGAAAAGTAAGTELAALLQRGVAGLGAALPVGASAAPPPPAPGPPSPRPLLAADPDLEEFMQGAGGGSDAGASADGGSAAGDEGAGGGADGGADGGAASGGEEGGEDDLDRYITELAAEVGGGGGEGGGEESEEGDAELEADVDAALRELEDGAEDGAEEGEGEEEPDEGGEAA